MLKGVDVSGWQRSMSFGNNDFVIIKASEGCDYKDKMLDTHYNNVAKEGKLYGFYHYARPDLGSTPIQEADFFLSLVGHHKGKCLYVLDWESLSLNYSTDWALQWLQRVEEKTGVKPLIYLQASQEWTRKYENIRKADYGLWVAHWGVDKPRVDNWQVWALWQFTDTPLDTNYFNGNVETWRKYCGSKTPIVDNSIKVGDTVKVTSLVDYNGHSNDAWILKYTFKVMEVKGDRVVIGNNNVVTGVWRINRLQKV